MFSITGYFFVESKFVGRMMTPQMSVFPSRPFAVNTSGGRQPVASSALASARSSSATHLAVARAPQLHHRRQIDARVQVDEVLMVGRVADRVVRVAPSVSGVSPVPSKLIRYAWTKYGSLPGYMPLAVK